MKRRHDERGTVSIEAAIVLVAMLVFIGMLIAVGRYAIAKANVVTAAEAAARAASLERSPGAARNAAASAAAGSLNQQSMRCAPAVTTDTGGFSVPVGKTAEVTSAVRCVVAMGDLSVPGLPGTITLTATASSPLDTYRQRVSR